MVAAFVLFIGLKPLHYTLETTSIKRVEIEKRNLQSVVQDVVRQVEAKNQKTLRVIYSPETLRENTREKNGGVFGNPPVEGSADDALTIVAFDYHCQWAYLDEQTILFYHIVGD